MTAAPKCKLCGARHWSYENHVIPGSVTKTVTVKGEKTVTETVTPKTVTRTVTQVGYRDMPEMTAALAKGGRGKRVHKDNAARQAAYRVRLGRGSRGRSG